MDERELDSTLQEMRDLIPKLERLQDHIQRAAPKIMTTASSTGWGLPSTISDLRSALEMIEQVRPHLGQQ